MTSDVVPVGSRNGTTASDDAIGEEATSAVETPETVSASAGAADGPAASKGEGAMVNDPPDDVTTPDVRAVSASPPDAADEMTEPGARVSADAPDESNAMDATGSDQSNGAPGFISAVPRAGHSLRLVTPSRRTAGVFAPKPVAAISGLCALAQTRYARRAHRNDGSPISFARY